jgi:protein-disulfide isomerase
MSTEVKIIGGISIVTLILVIGAAILFGGKSTAAPTEPIANTEALIRKNSHQTNPKASVTLVEFGDFQCPACYAAYPTIEKIEEEYKGKINFVFRHFPLTQHKNAKQAAETAEAAGAQGKFFEMYRMLYTNQKDWGESDKAMEYFTQYAKALRLDMDKFAADLKSNKYEKQIQNDTSDGYAVGVNATPTFFVNGVPVQGGVTYDELKEKIDDALTKTQ